MFLSIFRASSHHKSHRSALCVPYKGTGTETEVPCDPVWWCHEVDIDAADHNCSVFWMWCEKCTQNSGFPHHILMWNGLQINCSSSTVILIGPLPSPTTYKFHILPISTLRSILCFPLSATVAVSDLSLAMIEIGLEKQCKQRFKTETVWKHSEDLREAGLCMRYGMGACKGNQGLPRNRSIIGIQISTCKKKYVLYFFEVSSCTTITKNTPPVLQKIC